jgi:hypothetical protein
VKVGDSAPVVASVVRFGGDGGKGGDGGNVGGNGGKGGKGGNGGDDGNDGGVDNGGSDEPNKSKVGAAPNMGAGSPVSLAAIVRKATSQKMQARK